MKVFDSDEWFAYLDEHSLHEKFAYIVSQFKKPQSDEFTSVDHYHETSHFMAMSGFILPKTEEYFEFLMRYQLNESDPSKIKMKLVSVRWFDDRSQFDLYKSMESTTDNTSMSNKTSQN